MTQCSGILTRCSACVAWSAISGGDRHELEIGHLILKFLWRKDLKNIMLPCVVLGAIDILIWRQRTTDSSKMISSSTFLTELVMSLALVFLIVRKLPVAFMRV